MLKVPPLQLLRHSTKSNYTKMVNVLFTRTVSRECRDDPGPRCPKLRDDNVCSKVPRKSDKKPLPRPKTSNWVEPECCKVLQCDWVPRYDDMYWKESDKNKRQYTQTWVSCPEFKMVPRTCEYDTIDPPPMEKRKRKEIKKMSACPLKVQCPDLSKPCPKIVLEKCRKARENTRCLKNREPKDCKKYCPPQPSYSECRRRIIKYFSKTQCNCNDIPMLCEVMAEGAAQGRLKKIIKDDCCPK